MQEFIEFILTFLVVYFVTKFIISFVVSYYQIKNENLEKDIRKTIKDNFIFVKAEKHGDVIYLFESETDRFIAQGKDKEELTKSCRARYPDKNIVMADENAKNFNL